jgi:hypothetical protein
MVRYGRFDASELLPVFWVLGIAFSPVAWLLTIGIQPLPYEVREPRQETAALLIYLTPLAVFIAYGFSAIHRWVPGEPVDSLLILAAKLVHRPNSYLYYRNFALQWESCPGLLPLSPLMQR